MGTNEEMVTFYQQLDDALSLTKAREFITIWVQLVK